MKISKAVITAAVAAISGRYRFRPSSIGNGVAKSALRIVLEEATMQAARDVCVIIAPGDRPAYERAAGDLPGELHFVEQAEPLGHGHALYLAKEFVCDDPFLHLVSDHLSISDNVHRCAQQLVQTATAEQCAVSAVQPQRESMLPATSGPSADSAWRSIPISTKSRPWSRSQRRRRPRVADCPRAASRTLPVLVRHARFNTHGDAHPGRFG